MKGNISKFIQARKNKGKMANSLDPLDQIRASQASSLNSYLKDPYAKADQNLDTTAKSINDEDTATLETYMNKKKKGFGI